MLRKSISVILVLVMILSIFTILPTVSAEETQSVADESATDEFTIQSGESNVTFVETDNTVLSEASDEDDSVQEAQAESPIEPTSEDNNDEDDSADLAPVGDGSYTVNGFTYSVTDRQATITYYNDSTITEIDIPAKLGGYKVTAIANSVFRSYSNLTVVNIPDSVITIGEDCFQYTPWYNNQPDGLVYAGRVAYKYKGNMPKNTIITLNDNTASVSPYAFVDCSQLKEVVFNDGIEVIGGAAFKNCTLLERAIIPDSVTNIGSSAFYGCVSMDSLKLSENLTTIGIEAFRNCTSLTEVFIPKYVTSASSAFSGCENLEKIEFEEGINGIPGGIASNCKWLEEVIIPNSVTTIGGYAFSGDTALSTIDLPDSITSIGSSAFYNCISIKDLSLPKNLDTLGTQVFECCSGLTHVTIPKSLINVYSSSTGSATYGPFYRCNNLKKMTFEDGTIAIPPSIAASCGGLEEIRIPEGVTTIDYCAFSENPLLKNVALPTSLVSIGNSVFRNCTSLTEITIPKNVTTVNSYPPFYGCTNLKRMVFEEGIVSIPDYIAQSCTGLEDVSIPDGVTSIGYRSFSGDTALSSVYLPQSLITIGGASFQNCPNLTVYCDKYSKAVVGLIDNNTDVITYNDTRTVPSAVLDDANSFYEARNTTGTSFVCNYSIPTNQFSSIRNPYVKIKIPTGTVISDQSLYHNGVICTDFSDYTSYITVPVKTRQGKISFNLTLTEDTKMVTYATLNYTKNGKSNYDIIDIINNDIPILAVYSEDITSSDKVHISGMAPASSEVKISVDGTYVKSVNSNKAGTFSADVNLPSPEDNTDYTISVSSYYDGKTIKSETSVRYRENAPELIGFTMSYKGATYDLLTDKNYSISFVPGSSYPFHFEVKFKNPEGISSVYVSSTRNQNRKSVEAKWNNSTKSFIFDGFFDTSNYSYVPGKITVGYSLKYDDLQEPNIDDFDEIVNSADVKVNKQTDDEYDADIDFGSGNSWNYNERLLYVEDLEAELQSSEDYSNGELVPTGADNNGIKMIFTEYVTKLIEKYGEKVITNIYTDTVESELLEAYVQEDDKDEITRYFYDPAASVIKKQTIKYALGTGAYLLGSVPNTGGVTIGVSNAFKGINIPAYKTAIKGAGVVVSTGKTLIEYGNQMYDVNKIENQINNSNMSSSQKSGYKKELNTVRNGYTMVAAFDIAMACAGTLLFGPVGGVLFGVATGIISGLVKDEADKLLEMIDTGTSSQMNFLVDPSGYVYSCVTTNRISGAKVTTYWIPYDEDDEDFWDNPDESNSRVWEADEYSQINPLYTDDNGDYAWDVPEGWWKVVVEKEGYETYTTDWLPVPPPQTDVNINLISRVVPELESAEYNEGVLTISFSEYMSPETIKKTIVNDYRGANVSYTLDYSKEEKDSKGNVFAKEYQLIFTNGYQSLNNYYSLVIKGAESCSGVRMNDTSTEIGEKPDVELLLGDVDGDGEIMITDCTFLQRKVAEIDIPFAFCDAVSDVDGDGEITVMDATAIQYYLANMNVQYNIGKSI